MECTSQNIDLQIGDKSLVVYANFYHTGDPELDELLELRIDNETIRLSIEPENPRRISKIYAIQKWNSTISINTNGIIVWRDNRKLEFSTKNEFAVLKTLLVNEVYQLLLGKHSVDIHLDDDPDLMCSLSVEQKICTLLLIVRYFNTKYGFEYIDRCIITPEWEWNIKSLDVFTAYIDRFLYSKNKVQQKLRNVQIYLLHGDREVPGFYPENCKKHKMIIENTFEIIECDSDGMEKKLARYMKLDIKLPNLLPTAMKRC
jgi:hypothetical protein